MGHKRDNWQSHELATVRYGAEQGLTAKETAALLPGREERHVYYQRRMLGLEQRKNKRFEPWEDVIIKREHAAHTLIQDIIPMLKPGRRIGTVQQRILKLGLKRDARKTSLARRFGKEALALAPTVEEARRMALATERGVVQAERANHLETIMDALDMAEKTIAEGGNRKAAFQQAMVTGASLQQVGDRFDITRERVRQIVHDVKGTPSYKKVGSVDAECEACGATYSSNHKNRRYCDECRKKRAYKSLSALSQKMPETVESVLSKFLALPFESQRKAYAEITDNILHKLESTDGLPLMLPPEFVQPDGSDDVSKNTDNSGPQSGSDPIKKDAH